MHEVLAYRGTYWPRVTSFLARPVLMCRLFFGGFVDLRFCPVRAENAFWSLLLHLAAQVLAHGVGDVASA